MANLSRDGLALSDKARTHTHTHMHDWLENWRGEGSGASWRNQVGRAACVAVGGLPVAC